MRNSISKAIVASVAALGVSAAVVVPSEPALAQWHGGGGGGWHGGGGGWHGGGWGGGGWHGGGWHGGWGGGGGRFWHPGYWNGGVWYNGWWGPAIAAGVLTGAAIASYPYWGGGYNNGCWGYRPTYDGYGRFLGQQWVNVCQ